MNPSNPTSPLSPMNPANPMSPLNPMNMDDDIETTETTEVQKDNSHSGKSTTPEDGVSPFLIILAAFIIVWAILKIADRD